MKQKSGHFKAGMAALACMILIMCFMTACQPTPGKSAVQAKNSGLEEAIKKSLKGETYKAPGYWDEELELGEGKLLVDIDAPVTVPGVQDYPVTESVPGRFTLEQLNTMITYFAGDNPVFKDKNYGEMPVTIYDSLETKQEIEAAILQLKLALSDPESNLNSIKESDPERYRQGKEDIESQIKVLTEELFIAPETAEQTPLILDDSIKTNNVNGIVYLDKARPATIEIYATENESGRNNFFRFTNMGSMIGDGSMENIETELWHPPKISMDEAIACAQRAVSDLAGGDMRHARTAAASYSDSLSPVRAETYRDNDQYYVLLFTRSVNNVPYTYENTQMGGLGDYYPPYPYEYIEVSVDDSGILQFVWRSPSEIVNVLTESIALLPFEEIKEIFKQQILSQQVWQEEDSEAIYRTVYIENITLGMMRVINPERRDEYLMIPVWDFFGYYSDKYPDGYKNKQQLGIDKNNEDVDHDFAKSMLTINAYDGTIIDRGAGY